MSGDIHKYEAQIDWTGSSHGPTSNYEVYSREYTIVIPGKPLLKGSADPVFRGEPALHNPEDLLVVALSACHMLSYLAICARAKLPVVSYKDRATGKMETSDGLMRFTEVILRPEVTIGAGTDLDRAIHFHHDAHNVCFIANSVNFPVKHQPRVEIEKR